MDRKILVNTEKWPLKCDNCGKMIQPKKKYTDIGDGLGKTCGDEECTIRVEDAVNDDGA